MKDPKTRVTDIPVVTIDGPSGAGKGTISQILAGKLGFHYLDSGALYRLTALAAERKGVDWQDEAKVADIARNMTVQFQPNESGVNIYLDGQESSDDIRREQMSIASSIVAAHPLVREALLDLQLNFKQAPGLVADGRDMGTTVFPHAAAKIFLTASAEARAARRHRQLAESQLLGQGESGSLRALLADIRARDLRDSQRSSSPLKPAEDALVIDSTALTIDEVVDAVLAFLQPRHICPANSESEH